MTQPMMIALVAVIFLQERLAEGSAPAQFSTPAVLIQGLLLLGGITGLAALRLVGARRRLDRTGRAGALIAADRVLSLAPLLIVTAHCLNVLFFHWLAAIRDVTGDLVFIDEALATLPPLIGIVVVWYMYYPIDRRVRQALLMRHLDRSLPVPPILSRWQYVVLQVRHQFLLTLLPLGLILLWIEIVHGYLADRVSEQTALLLQVGGVLAVFLIAPVLIRHAWDTVPLAEGQLRRRLADMCGKYGARVREILVWRTHGGMINGAVMGLIAPLRYVLLTDGLLESMSDRHIEAVMAHEIGHVKRWHLPTLVGLLMVCVSTAAFVFGLALQWAAMTSTWWWVVTPEFIKELLRRPEVRIGPAEVDVAVTAGSLIVGLVIFGYFSRRFERQADTFAVQHLSTAPPKGDENDPHLSEELASDVHAAALRAAQAHEDDPEKGEHVTDDETSQQGEASDARVVTVEAAEAMAGALEAVARLNHIPPDRKSWRHGSIRWRQRYLMSLVGQPLDRLRIDRQIRRFQALALLGGGLVLAVVIYDLITNPELVMW